VLLFYNTVVLVGLCVCSPASAESNSSDEQTIGKSETSSSLPRYYQRWLDEDVRWIIEPSERAVFLQLSKNEERDHFIELFWLTRNPRPGSSRNLFKEEHYRRIAYANVHFAWQPFPGWKTDRGRVYIVLGPPDALKVGRATVTDGSLKPAEVWHYESVQGSATDFSFVDICGCGDYRLAVASTK
jgi:GWxTD domain-containing protein